MAKYHIKLDGTVGACRARTRPCPLGGESEHYPTKEAAQEAAQKKMESQYGVADHEPAKGATVAPFPKTLGKHPLYNKPGAGPFPEKLESHPMAHNVEDFPEELGNRKGPLGPTRPPKELSPRPTSEAPKAKALRADTVDTSLKTKFGVTMGKAGQKARLVGFKSADEPTGYSTYLYETSAPGSETKGYLRVSTRNGRVAGSSTLSEDRVKDLELTKVDGEVFPVEHGDLDNVDPFLDHETPKG